MNKICVFTGTRADYGLLRNLLKRLKDDSQIDLDILVSGSHLNEQFGNTFYEIEKDGFKCYTKLPIPIEDDSKCGMAKNTGMAITVFADYFKMKEIELLIVLGDRFEALAVSIAAYLQGIPIAHISGGDITEGAVDDAIRHCITKMSYLHFPGCEDSAHRIIQMGESPNRVFNVGEPGIENCLNTRFLTLDELSESIPKKIVNSDFAIVTFHPVTMENNTATNQLLELIHSMDYFSRLNYIITLANADSGGREINKIWDEEGRKRNNWFVTPSLGVTKYLSVLKYSKAVIGNSSSGIYEAPVFGIPTVNIGDRQKGRMKAESIIDCQPVERNIKEAIELALSDKYQQMAKNIKSPFGDGTASTQIVKHIKEYLENPFRDLKKQFYEINFEVKK